MTDHDPDRAGPPGPREDAPDRRRGPVTPSNWAERYGRGRDAEERLWRGEGPAREEYVRRDPPVRGARAAIEREREWERDWGFIPDASAERPSYAGLGPRGYRRADARILDDVCEALTRHPEIDAAEMEVRVADGEVILTGTVADRRSKRLAEDVAEGCEGVRDVRNELRLR